MQRPWSIGLYGGSFDPIHHGHLVLALDMLEAHHLDAVWICPAHISPFRLQAPPASAHHRLTMVRHAIAPFRQLKLLADEVARPPPSYTVDTLRARVAAAATCHPPTRFFLILGADSAASFFDWHQPEEIVKLCTVLVGKRSTATLPPQPFTTGDPVADALYAGITVTRQIDISSSEIRARLANGLPCDHLMPLAVGRYIRRHRLYTSSYNYKL